LALLAVALAVPAAHAMRDFSAGTGGSSTSAGSGTSNAQQLPTLAQVQQHQGVAAAAQPLTLAQTQRIFSRKSRAGSAPSVASVPLSPATGTEAGRMRLPAVGTLAITQPTSSGQSSTTYWVIGAVAAALIVGIAAWAVLRRRRQLSVPEASAYCAFHPGDSQCRAG
jgi:hypothetical protein